MNKILVFLATLASLLTTGRAQAQQEQYRWRVGAYLGSMLYYGDLNQQLIPEEAPDQPAFGFSVERLLNKAWSAKLLYTQGQWVANDRTNDEFLARSLNAKTEVQDYSLLFTYYLDNNRQLGRRSFVAPYFSFGLGYTDFNVFGDMQDGRGANYHYWSDYTIRSVAENDPAAGNATLVTQDGEYETNLSVLATEQSYPTESFNLPVALGLKLRLATNVNLNLELLMRYAFTDYLDDVSGAYRTEYANAAQRYAGNPTERDASQRGSSPTVNDFYAFPSVSLHYNFARRKTSYRAPKLYAVANRVDRFTISPHESLIVTDTIATLLVGDHLDSAGGYALADSLKVVPHVVGQDTLLAIVHPVADSLASLSLTDTLSSAALPNVSLDTIRGGADTLLILSNALAARVVPDRITGDTVLQVVQYVSDSAGQVLVIDTLATQSLVATDTTLLLSDSLALRMPTDSVGQPRTVDLVRVRASPLVDTLALFGTFDPRPAAREPMSSVARSDKKSVPFSTLPEKTKVATSTTQPARGGMKSNDTPTATTTNKGERIVSVKPTEKKPLTTSANDQPPKVREPNASFSKPTVSPSGTPLGVGIAVVPTASSRSADDTIVSVLDTSYVATLNARMDTFSGYLNEVSQKNDTSFTSILNEVKQLKAQLSNIQNAPQPTAQATSIEQRLRSLKLRELGTTEVFFSVGSSAVSTSGTERLQQVAVLVQNAPNATVRLRGFTDTTGNPERNQLLSQRRAEAVRKVLSEAGVSDQRISAAFFGADRTLSKEEASYGRRVEVVVED
jgi:outer membrane protein OmpA-like peptidoglycan-associated protein